MGSDGFWATIAQQVEELRTARSADDVVRILSDERNPLGPGHKDGAADGFFAGGGGDDTVWNALTDARWSVVWAEADYYFLVRAPDGSHITYIEGDIYRGDKRPRGYHCGICAEAFPPGVTGHTDDNPCTG